MARGFSKTKKHTETPGERKSRLGGYAYDLKTYKADTELNAKAKAKFKRPAYYTGVKKCSEQQNKKDITE